MWSDSNNVLAWLSSEKILPVFIAKKNSIILDYTTTSIWRNVKAEINPTDLGKRGLALRQILENTW